MPGGRWGSAWRSRATKIRYVSTSIWPFARRLRYSICYKDHQKTNRLVCQKILACRAWVGACGCQSYIRPYLANCKGQQWGWRADQLVCELVFGGGWDPPPEEFRKNYPQISGQGWPLQISIYHPNQGTFSKICSYIYKEPAERYPNERELINYMMIILNHEDEGSASES